MASIFCFNEECIHNDNMYVNGSGYCMKKNITLTVNNDFECADAEYDFLEENQR